MAPEAYIPLWVAVVTAVPGIISAVLGFIVKSRQARNHQETGDRLNALEENTNGKMDALLRVTGAEQRRQGVIEGRAEKEE